MKLRKIFIRFISLAGLLFLAVSFVAPAQAKEIWLNPAEAGNKRVGNWGGVKFKKEVHFQWHVPNDFETSPAQSGNATLLVIGLKNKEIKYQVNVNVAIGGDLNDVNLVNTGPLLPIALTAGTLTEIPIVGVVPNLVPGDYVALNIENLGSKKKPVALIVGLRYDYASTVVSPADFTALQADIAVLQTENASQATTITAQASALTALQTEQGTQNTSIASLLTVNGTQTTDITALQTANTTQDSAITAIQTEQGTQNTSIASLETENTSQASTIASQTGEITALQTANTTQDSNIAALVTEQGTQNGSISTLQADVSTLNTNMGNLETTFAGVSRTGDDIFFDGVNVHIRDGSGATDGLPGAGEGVPNGLGNLIVGYDEARASGSDKTGSHNLVVGENHNYSSFAGLVAGYNNTISGSDASVSGGWVNTASGDSSNVSGGLGRSTPGSRDWAAGSLFEDN